MPFDTPESTVTRKDPDFNLLRIFEALYEDRSASRAAIRLNMTQSAVSQRLKTLRQLFNDPLFKNTGRGLAPTARAVALRPHVQETLQYCRACFSFFNAAGDESAVQQLVIGMSDDFELAAGNEIIRTFAQKLPMIRIVFKQTNTKLAKDMLLARDIDLAVTAGGFDSLSLSRRLISPIDDAVIVAKASCPEGQTCMTVEEIVARPHLLVQAGGFVGTTDTLLSQMGYRRTIRAATSHFAAIPHLIKGTDMIVNAPVHVARALCACNPDLCWFAQPLKVNVLNIQVGWKTSSSYDTLFTQAKDLLIDVLMGLQWRV